MAVAFEPRFVDLVRNFTSTAGTGNFVIGKPVAGHSSFVTALSAGNRFYYCAVGIDLPDEREVGRGTLLANGTISREAISGALTNFSAGMKTISLVAPAEWFAQMADLTGCFLFTEIASKRFLSNVDSFRTSGRSEHGKFGARYIRDPDQSQYTTTGQSLINAGKLTAAQVTAILNRIRIADADGIYWTIVEPVLDAGHFGAIGNGVVDDTAAIQAAIDRVFHWHGGGILRIGEGQWAVSAIRVQANVRIATAGTATRIKQIAGQPTGTRVVYLVGSNIEIGDMIVEGNIALDTGQQHHGIYILANASTGDLSNIAIGDIEGRNLRGDTIYVGSLSGYSVSGVRVGNVKGTNVYRNAVSIIGGRAISIKSISGSAVGYMHLLVEPNAGQGGVSGVQVGHVRGRLAGVVSPTAADCIEGVEIGTVDLDASSAGSTPAFTDIVLPTTAFQVRNCRNLRIATFLANGFAGAAMVQQFAGGDVPNPVVQIGFARVTNCALVGTANYAYFQGAIGLTMLNIETLVATTTQTNQRVLEGCSFHRIGTAIIGLAPSTTYVNYCNDGVTDKLIMTVASGNGGGAMISANRCSINGGSIVGDRLASYSAKCSFRHLNATAATALFVAGDDHDVRNCTLNGVYSGETLGISASAASIAAAANAINTTAKFAGKMVWDSTNSRMMRASGTAATAAWHGLGGGVAVTPV